MRRTLAVAASALIACLATATAASAHYPQSMTADCTGASLTLASFSKSDGPVNYTVAVDGKQTNSGTEPAFYGSKTIAVTYPAALAGPASHSVVFSASWTTSHGSLSRTVTGCPAPPLPCPEQPPTAPCNCPPGPAGPAGPAGPPGVTIVVNQPPPTCTSRRKYAFRVRASYMGHRVVGVKAFEPGQHPVVRLHDGRRVVSWSTVGQVFPRGGVLRVMGVVVRLDNGRHVRLRYFYRPCASKDGNPNDPSAAGQGSSGGTQGAVT